ncbi:AraC family transcriptional regulator [Arthrobacter sp. H5]|uniref:helix-turn-helix domain-containing protein n=1 Tax=Arthrobacter sp. H5 TaxID=1267973 RepID=UPI0004B002EE|nr:AraC family transcriptional regulator [Arthrobacter sp. H5]
MSGQKVLQYPSTLLVIAPDYAIVKGPELGLSHKELRGTPWAFGVLFQAAAGYRLHGAQLPKLVNNERPLSSVDTIPGGEGLIRDVRAEMSAAPSSLDVHSRCMALTAAALAPICGPLDAEDKLINAITDQVETSPSLTRVDKLAAHAGLDERALQRLTRKRLGLSPKWLIQRRRLQEAGVRLAAGGSTVSDVASDLGYSDQAHFTRDFSRVVGMTPGGYLRLNNP